MIRKIVNWGTFFCCTIFFVSNGIANDEMPSPPPPPMEAETPHTDFDLATIVYSTSKFAPGIHKEMVKLRDFCSDPLNKAIYNQDILHQFQSKAHFDNCAFEESIAYINELISNADSIFLHADKIYSTGLKADSSLRVAQGIFILGQALHAIQDFYSHSNFIELIEDDKKQQDLESLPTIKFWEKSGAFELKKYQDKGLISGYVFWGVPQNCKSNTPTHHTLAKDSKNTKSGKITTKWKSMTRFQVARKIASDESTKFIWYAYKRWPLIKKICGDAIAVHTSIDRRGLD